VRVVDHGGSCPGGSCRGGVVIRGGSCPGASYPGGSCPATPGGHVEFFCARYFSRHTIDADMKPTAMNLVGPVVVHN